MKKPGKKIVVALLALLMAFAFTACGGRGKDDLDIDNSDDPNAIELRIAYQQDSTEAKNTSALANAFIKAQKAKGVSVKIKPVAVSASSYNESVLKMHNAGTIPDVVYTYDDYASLWAQNGVFENLDPYFTQANFDFTQYDELAFTAARVYQDHIYYAPREYNHPVVYVNMDKVQEYGLDISSYQDGWTWDEMLAFCAEIREKMDKKANKDYIYPLDSSMEWAAMLNGFVRSYGGYLFDPNGTPGFAETGTVTAMQQIYDLIKDRYIADPRSNVSGNVFLNENAVMWIMSRPRVSSCRDSEISLGFLPMPEIGNGEHYLCYGNTGYAIASASKQKALAWEFLQFLMSAQGQEVFSATGNAVPVLLSMQNDADATWRKCLAGVNQDAFIRTPAYMQKFTYIPTTYARGYNPAKERDIYNKVGQLMRELANGIKNDGADAFCQYAQGQVNGVK